MRPWAKADEDVQRTITYFTNQSGAGRIDYDASRVAVHELIGSGVMEAACKVLVKRRLCGSGMKWKEPEAAAVLSVRRLTVWLSIEPTRGVESWPAATRTRWHRAALIRCQVPSPRDCWKSS